MISFRINGLEPGAATSVVMTTITGASPVAGTSYWKYGSPTPGAADRWYKFDHDEATGTGATLSEAIDIPGVGLRRAFQLDLRDGARGDNDGGANGTISDPGGPVTGGDTQAPTDTTTPPATTPPATGTAGTGTPPAPAPTGGGATVGGVVTSPGGSATNPAPSSSNTTGTLSGGPLAFTGNNPLALLLIAAALILIGTITTRRQRRIATRKTR